MIRYGQQHITQADIDAVSRTLTSINLTQGPQIEKFEASVLEHTGARHAVAVNSATSALHIACLSLGLGPGDVLWTSPNTFVASANCALYCGASVDFVDINPKTYNICEKRLEEKLLVAERTGKLPKIVIPVHFAGQSCDLYAIKKLSQRFGFYIIEDASHAIGGQFDGKPVGSCELSDITVFSFHPVKIVTTAEGGMALTNSDVLASRLRLLRSHGITRDTDLMTEESHGPWYYQQVALGFNYRMTDLQASLGVSQMTRLSQYIRRRHEIATRYDDLLKNLPVTCPWRAPYAFSAFHLYVVRLQLGDIARSHREVFEYLRARDILVNLHYIPVHTQPFYSKQGFQIGDFPESELYYKEAISLPIHPSLSAEDQDYVVDSLRDALGA
jgi:UDP-4-amino-4,6-dideoxy-N-acetyl-beta-L-altrosamine transaminase